MNERLIRLAENAGFRPGDPNWGVPRSTIYPPANIGNECGPALQQFAAAIIEECIKQVNNRREIAIEGQWNVDEAFYTAVHDIEDHFGITHD